MRPGLLLLLAFCAFGQAPREFVHAVEFRYYAYPESLWERELVWLRNIGIRTVAFSVPARWHQPESSVFDFTGASAPRRNLAGFLRLIRRLDLRAWIRGDVPGPAQRLLDPGILIRPSGRIEEVSATAPDALVRSRRALSQPASGLLWRDVEDYIVPAGYEQTPGITYRRGAVSVSGEESSAAAALRRNAALLAHWGSVLPVLRPQEVRPPKGEFPRGVAAVQLLPRNAQEPSAVSVTNTGDQPFTGELRVYHPGLKRFIMTPAVTVAARGALWIPVRVPLADPRVCRNCSAFAPTDHIVYATAELQMMEYENGNLALEFAAPVSGEVVLQLSRQPTGPALAGGRPADFQWDAEHFRARLPIPAGRGLGQRVRISLAMEPPEASGFLKDLTRLLIGRGNSVAASFSSEELAARSRLRVPEGFTARLAAQAHTEVAYEVIVPETAVHGEFCELALEADGVTLGRARVPVLMPGSLRLPQAIRLHAGNAAIPIDPPIVAIDPRGSRNLEITVRNHSNEIRTFVIAAEGEGLEFSPAKTEISIGAAMERIVSLRAFAQAPGLHRARLRMSGDGNADMPVRLLAVPRNRAIVWQADLDGDGLPEHVLENYRARAVFSTAGGRWLEFVWKDTATDVLPQAGAFIAPERVKIESRDGALRIEAANWTRTIHLDPTDARLTIEQTSPLPALPAATVGNLRFSSADGVFTIEPAQ
jgi:hypothetical protein